MQARAVRAALLGCQSGAPNVWVWPARAAAMSGVQPPDAIEALFTNPATQCTLFPFLGALTDSKDAPACWDMWYNTLFVHEIDTEGGDLVNKWDKAPGISPYMFGYTGLAFAIAISVCGAAW